MTIQNEIGSKKKQSILKQDIISVSEVIDYSIDNFKSVINSPQSSNKSQKPSKINCEWKFGFTIKTNTRDYTFFVKTAEE